MSQDVDRRTGGSDYQSNGKEHTEMNSNTRCNAILLAAVFMTLTGMAWATDVSWTNGSGGAFSDTANWMPGQLPGNNDSAIFGLGSGNYKVTFTNNRSSANLVVTNANTVTLDLGGNKYDLSVNPPQTGYPYPAHIWIGSNASDRVTLVVTNGTVTFGDGAWRYDQFAVGANSSTCALQIAQNGRVNYDFCTLGANGSIIVAGSSSKFWQGDISSPYNGYLDAQAGGTLIVSNGGLVQATMMSSATMLVDNGTLQGNSDYVIWKAPPSSVTVRNGGLWTNNSNVSIGQNYQSATQTVSIGGGSGTSIFAAKAIGMDGWAYNRAPIDLRVTTGGVIQVTGAGYTKSGAVGDMFVADPCFLTLDGGAVQMNGGSTLTLAYGNAGVPRGTLRGIGTITRYGSGPSNFSLVSNGKVFPGDTTASASIGTITITNGDLNLLGGVTTNSTVYLDFNSTSSDLVDVYQGNVTISGTLVFNILNGYLPQKKSGKRWDLFRVDSGHTLVCTATDNLSSVMPSGWTRGTNYVFGVVTTASGQTLRLSIPANPTGTMIGFR